MRKSGLSSPETPWIIPEPLSIHETGMDDGSVIILRRHGNPDGPRLVLSHGNGLAVDLYYPFWSQLADDFDLVVYDLRNHGWNEVTSLGNHTIPNMVRDHDRILEEIDLRYGRKPQVGVFHSVSALVSLLSPTNGAGYRARVLFDPPMCKPGFSFEEFDASATEMAKAIRRRSTRFQSKEELAVALRFLPPFQRAVPGVFDLVPKTTLRKSADDPGFELCCPPEYEAQIIDYATIFAVSVDYGELLSPVKVIGADPTLPYAYLPTFDFSEVITVDYDFIPEATHFLQLEKPRECAEAVLRFIETTLQA